MTSKSMTVIIEDVPVSQNVYQHWHWAKKGRYKKKWESRIIPYGYIWQNKWRDNYGRYAKSVEILYCFDDKRRRDKDNYCYFKAIMDGLVKAGIIGDDNVKDVKMKCDVVIGMKERATMIEVGA